MIQLTGFSGFSDAAKAEIDSPLRLTEVFSSVISTLTIFAGLAFLVYFIIGALGWITGGDNQGQLEKAKKQMSNALIGLIVAVAIIPITYLVGKLTGIDILNIESVIGTLGAN